MSRLTLRYIREKEKRGYTLDQIATDCGTTKDTVINLIKEKDWREARKILKNFEANAERKKLSVSKPEKVILPKTINLEKETVAQKSVPKSEPPKKDPIEDLRAKERKLSSEIKKFEDRHKEIVSQRRSILDELRQLDKKLSEIKKKNR